MKEEKAWMAGLSPSMTELKILRLWPLIFGFLFVSKDTSFAHTYPPTKAGLQRLVADDAAMLPPARAAALKKEVAGWEKLKVTCYHYRDGTSNCYPEPKNFIDQIQKHIFKADDFVIDDDEWKVSIPSDNPPFAGVPDKPIELDQSFPDIVSPVTLQTRQFNEAVKQFGLLIWSEVGGPPRAYPEEDQFRDVNVDYSLNRDALPGVVSIGFSAGSSAHGSADGGYETDYLDFNWDVAAARPVRADDIFDLNTDWKNALMNAANNSLQNNEDFSIYQIPLLHSDFVSDTRRWAVLRAGFLVDGAFAFGVQNEGETPALVPWAMLKPYLKKGGLVSP